MYPKSYTGCANMYVCAFVVASFFSLFVCTPSSTSLNVFGTFSWSVIIVFESVLAVSFSSFSFSSVRALIASLANERFPRFGGIVFGDALCIHLGSTSFARASIGNVVERYTSRRVVIVVVDARSAVKRRAERHKRRTSDLVVPLRHAMSARRVFRKLYGAQGRRVASTLACALLECPC